MLTVPSDPYDGLLENKCWPSILVPGDLGFALLTHDEYYTRAGGMGARMRKADVEAYAFLPPQAVTMGKVKLWKREGAAFDDSVTLSLLSM